MMATTITNTNYSPTNDDLDQLYDNAHKNTVLAGFSRSIYLYFTDDLIELPVILNGYDHIDPRSSKKVKQKEVIIYPNPFSGNEFTVSRISKALDK